MGEIELDGRVLVIRRIHVQYYLRLDPDKEEAAKRVMGFHADHCPVARTLSPCVAISTSLEMENG